MGRATIGIVLLLFADAAVALTIEAKEARVKTVGGVQGDAWNLWSSGELGDFVHFEKAGVYKVRVVCYGSPCKGVWPSMGFVVDGISKDTVAVESNKPREYSFELKTEAGDSRITVSFLNDEKTEKEDRNLYVVRLEIEATGELLAPTLADEQRWQTDWRKRQMEQEAKALERAAASIEKNRKSDVTICVTDADGRPVEGVALAVEQVRQSFLFGGNIYKFDRFDNARDNGLYKERFRDLFNYATTGFYWKWYERERGKPDYAYTDKVVSWCAENHIRVKGHPLLWACDSGTPTWSQGALSQEIQKQRVADIMKRYTGKIQAWEVVNEPAHLSGLPVDWPYRAAHEADLKAYLIINDYYVMADGYRPFFDLLQKAKREGVPFDGIGIQAHEPRTMRFPLDQVWSVLDQYAALGKDLHITEFTPTSAGQPITGSHVTGNWDEAAQAEYAAKFYTVCFGHPSVVAITWWDLCDNGAWLAGGGLIRKDLSPKPAYVALKKLIRDEWMTKTAGKTGKDGTFSFRGFHGRYVVKAGSGGKTVEQEFDLGRDGGGTVNVTVR